MSRIFISYRRDDTAAAAGRIYDDLAQQFGHDAVFMDVDAIEAGEDFREAIRKVLSQCQVMLAVIGKSWLHAKDAAGRRRLENPADWVRLEIETALERKIRIIPVLSEGVAPPLVSELPESLQPLAYRQAAFVRHTRDFRRDMERLRGVIQRQLAAQGAETLKPVVTREPQQGEKPQRAKANSRTDSRIKTVGFEMATVNASTFAIQKTKTTGELFAEALGNGIALELMKIPSGSFMMGSPLDEPERWAYEGPQHRVEVPSFWMGRYPVTQAQWRVVAALPKVKHQLEASPSKFKGDNLPVELVSWYDAVEFCDRLSAHTGTKYRLPSEAEWEYACRAKIATSFCFGSTLTSELANYNANYTYGSGPKGEYRERTTEVGSFPANTFGLYDVHGNVWEWCQDYWHENYEGAPTDGSAWVTGGNEDGRVFRGGSWDFNPRYCRSAYRFYYTPDTRYNYIGFRVSCSAPRT